MTPRRYENASAFRTSLGEHLLHMAREAGTPLDRCARRSLTNDSWPDSPVLHLRDPGSSRGARFSSRDWEQARARQETPTPPGVPPPRAFAELLEAVVEIDLDDYFTFEVGEPRRITAETEDGGLRYKILALLDNRLFERLRLDVNFVPADPRPIEYLCLRGLLGFAGIAPPEVPVVPIAQHLAEKLHGYTREYGEQNSRPRDLFDMLVIASSLTVPSRARWPERAARRSTCGGPCGPLSWPPTGDVALRVDRLRSGSRHPLEDPRRRRHGPTPFLDPRTGRRGD